MEQPLADLSTLSMSQDLDGQLAWQVQLRWFASIGILEIRLRWLAAVGVLVVTWFASQILGVPLPTGPIYAIGVAMLVYNGLLRFYLERRFEFPRRAPGYDYRDLLRTYWHDLAEQGLSDAPVFNRFVRVQLGLDWTAMVLLIHFSGGVTSPLLFFFVFHLIVVSILLSNRDCYVFATVAALAVVLVTVLEAQGVIPFIALSPAFAAIYREPIFVAGVLVFFITSLYTAVFLLTTLTGNLRKRDRELLLTQQRLTSAYQIIHTLYDVTHSVSSTLDLDRVLHLIAHRAAEAMEVKACAIMLVSEGSTEVDTLAASGLSEAYLAAGPIDIEQNTYLHETLVSGRPTIVGNAAAQDGIQFPDETRAEGLAAILCVPVQIMGRAAGVLCAYSDKPNQFVDSDAEFLVALANSGATAIDNARAYQALELADRAKSEFVRMVTHEFRSPLSAVQSMLRLIELGMVGPLTEKQQDLVERAQRRIADMLAMVKDLLDLAAGKIELVQGAEMRVDLAQVIGKVTDLFQAAAQEKNLTYRVEIDDEPMVLNGSESGWERVLMNLVSNAVKYTPAGGAVSIRAVRRGSEIVLEVADTGIGIPEEAQSRIFSEFYRAKNAKAMAVEGTGLGLVIAKGIIEQHGGEIAVESVVDEGTVFHVTLPASLSARATQRKRGES